MIKATLTNTSSDESHTDDLQTPAKSDKGFTIIETLVAIAVLTISLTGPFYAVQTALTSSYVARDKLIASSLAQEGIEYIRSIRDNNFLASPSRVWLDGISSYACFTAPLTNYCVVDPTRGDIHTDSPDNSAMANVSSLGGVPFLKLNTANLYNQQPTSGTNLDTRFKRYVQITSISLTEARITVTVTWTTLKIPYSVVLTGYIRDWL